MEIRKKLERIIDTRGLTDKQVYTLWQKWLKGKVS